MFNRICGHLASFIVQVANHNEMVVIDKSASQLDQQQYTIATRVDLRWIYCLALLVDSHEFDAWWWGYRATILVTKATHTSPDGVLYNNDAKSDALR